MSSILQFQQSIFYGLLSCDLFDAINVVLERQLLQQGEVDYATVWQTPRNGGVGVGLLVEVPTLELPDANGLQRNLILSVVAIEERNINSAAGAISAEAWGELVLDFLHGWVLRSSSGMKPERRALERARDFVDVMAYRASVSVRREHAAPARVAPVSVSAVGQLVTLATATPGAAIYYTTDGSSFPGSANDGALGGQAATLYTVPFTVDAGTTVLACGFKDGLLPSHVGTGLVA